MKLAKTYPIRLVCRLLGVPRSSVYYAAPAVAADEAMLKTALLDLAGEWPTYGYRRLTAMMRRLGWPVNGKRVRRWMDELGIHGAAPVRKKRTMTIDHTPQQEPQESLKQELASIKRAVLRGRQLAREHAQAADILSAACAALRT